MVYVYIKSTDVPLNQLRNHAQNNRRAGAEKRYWVQGIQVASIVRRDYVKYEGSGSVTGPVSGINGSTYRADDATSHDYGISFLLADIDHDIPTPPSGPRTAPEVFVAPKRPLVIESIKGLDQLPPAEK